MLLAFLLHGLSLPAHEFLRGLLFVYGVQLHQLTPNSILHIAYFITLCEAFLGINPHWVLWKYLFRLRRNVSKEEIHDLGGTIVSVRSESQYLKFEIAESVQNWRQKWFYIKDHKSSETDEYGLAPFDPAKGLTKLMSWDALPSETEAEEIKPLLAHIQELKQRKNSMGHNSWFSSFSDEFINSKVEFQSYGRIWVRPILPECPRRIRR
jgi:hypothetical protein